MKCSVWISVLFGMACLAVAGFAARVEAEFLEMTAKAVPIEVNEGELIDLHIKIGYRENMTQADYPDFIELKADMTRWAEEYAWEPEPDELPLPITFMVRDIAAKVIANYPTIH